MRKLILFFLVLLTALPACAQDVTFLFDVSGSMMQPSLQTRASKIFMAKMAAKEMLRCLPPETSVGIRTMPPLRAIAKNRVYTKPYLLGIIDRIPDNAAEYGNLSRSGQDVADEARRHWGHPDDTLFVFTDSPADIGKKLGWTMREISEREPDLNIHIINLASRPNDVAYLERVGRSVPGADVMTSAGACAFVRRTLPAEPAGPVFTVYFAVNSAKLSKEAKAALSEIAPRLGAEKHVIAGYADMRGKNAANIRLATRRAEAVRKELIRCGVPASSLIVAGGGVSTADADRDLDRKVIIQKLR